jgi:hypothetical protein
MSHKYIRCVIAQTSGVLLLKLTIQLCQENKS